MTQLAQAKKEAKRLYSLAKSNPQSDLNIPSLSHAQKIVAFMNGYNNWHDFEQNLTKKEEIKDFGTIGMNKYLIEHSKPMNYLPLEIQKELEEYHLKANIEKIQIYNNNPIKYPIVIKNSGLNLFAGTTEIKGKFSTKEYKVPFRPLNSSYWGMVGSGLYTILESMAYQVITQKCGLTYVSSNGEIYNYFKFYIMSQETNRIEDLYCLNFNAQDSSQTHSIDPINPMIPFKDNFLLMLGMKDNAFSNIFYELCLYCYNHNIALDSNTLINLVSFNNLIDYKNHILKDVFFSQEQHINEYLASMGFTEDNDIMPFIQQHHISIKDLVVYLKVMKKYEDIGLFSCYAQIDLDMICSQSKILCVIGAKENDREINHLFMTQLLTIQKFVFQKLESNINTDYKNLSGFSTMNVFDNIGNIFNPITLSLFEKNLKEQKFRRIINIIASHDYNCALRATSFNSIPDVNLLNEVLFHFEQHMILKLEENMSIPTIIIEKIVKECDFFENFFYKKNDLIKNLEIGYAYYFYKSEVDVNEKWNLKKSFIKKGYFKKIKGYYQCPRLLHKENTLMSREVLRT